MNDKRSRLLFWSIAVLALLSVAATYYNAIILRNFVIIDDTDEISTEEEISSE